MKRFLIVVLAIGILALAAFYVIFCFGFYIDFHPEAPIRTQFTTESGEIVKRGDLERFQVKGVGVSASMPGHAASEFEAKQEDYLRWFTEIQELGANTIKVAGIMDDTFYEAFYTFNEGREQPLYLLQGILIQDAVNYGAGDAYAAKYLGALLEDGKRMVDVIHGNRLIMENVPGRGSGWYTKDISQWVLGFLVGAQWNGDTVVYTDHQSIHDGTYIGTYFVTTEGASPFEAMLAQVMDEITAYESGKYKEQHLIGFANEPATDPLEYRDDYGELLEKYEGAGKRGVTYARQLDKICQIDAEQIQTTEKVEAGYFAAYSLYDFCDDFSQYLSEAQQEKSAGILESLRTDSSYDGYLDFLGKYHTMPILCIDYGFSTARGVVSEEGFPLSEKEQGERLVSIYQDLCDAGWSGAIINGWQDRWELRSWNTVYAQDFTNNDMWHDVQTEAQSYGLMEFNAQQRVIDGKTDDWEEEDIVDTNQGLTVSVYADAEGLALLIEGQKVSEERALYLPIDTTPKSGSKTATAFGLHFSHPADFLICIDGRENSRILVQERYESVRANFWYEISGENPYLSFPDADSEIFIPIYMAMKNTTMVDYVDHDNIEQKYLPVYETGKLRHGNHDPSAEQYDSLADFCYGDHCVEMRIPWALLNVANPEVPLIHDDYYENYGVAFLQNRTFRIGVSEAMPGEIPMEPFVLKQKELSYQERRKQSFEMVQEAWR